MTRRIRPGKVGIGLLVLLALGLGCGRAPAATGARSLREEFRELIFENRRLVPLDAQVLSDTKLGNNRVEKVRFVPEAGEEAWIRIVRPQREARFPVVLVQHFLGGTKDDDTMSFLLNALAARGYLAAAIDGRYRGERGKGRKLPDALRESLRTGKGRPWLIDTVFDMLRTLDYLQTRADVDPKRFGVTGISEGGIETWMAAAADERIAVAVPVIGVTRFRNIVQAAAGPAGEEYRDAFEVALGELAKELGEPGVTPRVVQAAWERLIPGCCGKFDATELVPLIAPRPLLILCHEKDEIIPVEGAREVHAAAEKRYRELKAEDRLRIRVAPGLKHAALDLTEPLEIFAWFDRWLRGPAAREPAPAPR